MITFDTNGCVSKKKNISVRVREEWNRKNNNKWTSKTIRTQKMTAINLVSGVAHP